MICLPSSWSQDRQKYFTNSNQLLEEHVAKPTKIRGAYFIQIFNKDKIDFSVLRLMMQIKDPSGETIKSNGLKREAVFSMNVTKTGDYKFIFSNQKVCREFVWFKGTEAQVVTFALDVHNAAFGISIKYAKNICKVRIWIPSINKFRIWLAGWLYIMRVMKGHLLWD